MLVGFTSQFRPMSTLHPNYLGVSAHALPTKSIGLAFFPLEIDRSTKNY
jgi:hypothetical protein